MYFLLQDESEFVCHGFVEKLCERLMQWKQQRYGLPSAFISYFVLAGLEQDENRKSMFHRLKLCVQDKWHQVWNFIYVERGLIIIIPKMAYLGVISQWIGLTYSKKLNVQCQCTFCSSNFTEC